MVLHAEHGRIKILNKKRMFSLIITIIAIALVAALALATLYFGGSAFARSDAQVQAAKVHVHSEQILGATALFRADHGRWPNNLQELTIPDESGKVYLKAIPSTTSKQAAAFIQDAYAADGTWITPVEKSPTYVMAPTVSDEVCAEINVKSFGVRGVLKSAQKALSVQCYRSSAPTSAVSAAAPNIVIITRDSESLPTVLAPTEVVDGGTLPPVDSNDWYVKPTSTGNSGGTPNTSPSSGPQALSCSSGVRGVTTTGGDVDFFISGDNAAADFANASIDSGQGTVAFTQPMGPEDGVPSGILVAATLGSTPAGTASVSVSGANGKSVVCRVTVTDTAPDTYINGFSLSPSIVPEATTSTITVTALDGEFRMVDGNKPLINVNGRFDVPANDIEYLDNTTLRFKAPTLLQAGGQSTGSDQLVGVRIANFGTPYEVPNAYAPLTYTNSIGKTTWSVTPFTAFSGGVTFNNPASITGSGDSYTLQLSKPSAFTVIKVQNTSSSQTGQLNLTGAALKYADLSASGWTASNISSLSSALQAQGVTYCSDTAVLQPGNSCAAVVKSGDACAVPGPVTDLTGLKLTVNTIGCVGSGLELLNMNATRPIVDFGKDFGAGATNLPESGTKTMTVQFRNRGSSPIAYNIVYKDLGMVALEDTFPGNYAGLYDAFLESKELELLTVSDSCAGTAQGYGTCTLSLTMKFPRELYTNLPNTPKVYYKGLVIDGYEDFNTGYTGQKLFFETKWEVSNNTFPWISDNVPRRIGTQERNMASDETFSATITNRDTKPVQVNVSLSIGTLSNNTCVNPIPAGGTCHYSVFLSTSNRTSTLAYTVRHPYSDYLQYMDYYLPTYLVRD